MDGETMTFYDSIYDLKPNVAIYKKVIDICRDLEKSLKREIKQNDRLEKKLEEKEERYKKLKEKYVKRLSI